MIPIRLALLALASLLAEATGALASACDLAQVEVSTTPVIEQSAKRLVGARKQVGEPVEGADLLVFGDSIAAGWGRALAQHFPGRVMQNLGLGGERTQELIWRLDTLYPASFEPRDVVLIIGTNNFSDPSSAPCGVAAGMTAVVDRLTAIWPKATLHVFGILPRGKDLFYRREARLAVNDALSPRFKDKSNIRFIVVADEDLSCAAGRCAELRADMLHWTAKGYDLLAVHLEKAGLGR